MLKPLSGSAPLVTAALLAAGLMGCTELQPTYYNTCAVQLSLDLTEAEPGQTVIGTGQPFSEAYDTRVSFGGVDAPVLAVERTDCTLCDECRDATCDRCETCTDCDALCATCVQTVSFAVPEVVAGASPVTLSNRYGSSDTLSFTVLAPPSDTGDTGGDTGGGDTGDTGGGSSLRGPAGPASGPVDLDLSTDSTHLPTRDALLPGSMSPSGG